VSWILVIFPPIVPVFAVAIEPATVFLAATSAIRLAMVQLGGGGRYKDIASSDA